MAYFLFSCVFLVILRPSMSDVCQLSPELPSGDDYHIDRLDNLYKNHRKETINKYYRKKSLPNILFIIADDLGWNSVGFNGGTNIQTPNIDLMAKNGIKLMNHYSMQACSPTRGSLLTGKYPIHIGLQVGVIRPATLKTIPISDILLPEILSKFRNYQTSLIGKWHLGFSRWDYTPNERGFDHFYGFYGGNQDNFLHLSGQNFNTFYDFRDNFSVENNITGIYNAYLFTNKTIEIIQNRKKNKPFYIQLAYSLPHDPYNTDQVPSEWLAMYSTNYSDSEEERVHAAMMSLLDAQINRLKDYLIGTNLWSKTLVIFIGDNGNVMGDDRIMNYPLRGAKGTLWEGGIKSASFISGGYLKKYVLNSNRSDLMHVSDWFPTLLSFVGLNADFLIDELNLDGIDQRKMILNRKRYNKRDEMLLNMNPINCNSLELDSSNNSICGGIRYGNYKLLVGNRDIAQCGNYNSCNRATFWPDYSNPNNDTTIKCNPNYSCGITVAEWNTVRPPPYDGTGVLYNILDDPCECNNIRSENEEIYNLIFDKLVSYRENMIDPVSIETDPQMNVDNFNERYNGVGTPYGWLNGTCTKYDNLTTRDPTSKPTIAPIIVPPQQHSYSSESSTRRGKHNHH